MDDEYVRNGVASIFLEVEPLAGRRNVKITHRRTRVDWAQYIKEMLDERYPSAEKVILVMDNLNTHNTASLYQVLKCTSDAGIIFSASLRSPIRRSTYNKYACARIGTWSLQKSDPDALWHYFHRDSWDESHS